MLTTKARNIIYTVIGLVTLSVVIYMLNKTPRDDTNSVPMLKKVRDNFARMNPAYTSIPLAEGDSAYTENKNHITLCLRDPKTGSAYDENTIMYVALHELAHVVTHSQGHGDEFKANFNEILKRAADQGIYNPTLEIPSDYCGMEKE
jgi:hypothetical protein